MVNDNTVGDIQWGMTEWGLKTVMNDRQWR